MKLQIRSFSSCSLYIVSVISLSSGPMKEAWAHSWRSLTVVTPRLRRRLGCFMRVGQLVDPVVLAAFVVGHDLDLGAEAGDLGEVADRRAFRRELGSNQIAGVNCCLSMHVGSLSVLEGVAEEVAVLLELGDQVAQTRA